MHDRENRAAAAAMAAASGVSFSSGREIVMFFSQTGRASWLGVACAAMIFGLLCAGICCLSKDGERSAAAVFGRLGPVIGKCVTVLYMFFAAFAAVVMLHRAGRLAMLALPFHNACWMGVTAVSTAALLLNMQNMKRLPHAGGIILAASIVFHICLMLDRRPVPMSLQYETRVALEGSAAAALVLAVLHAALSTAAAICTVAKLSGEGVRPARFGLKCGVLMAAVLTCANGAVLSGGRRMLSLQTPTAALAARWGKAGFYASIAVDSLCCIASLAAFLNALGDCFAAIVKGLKHDKIMC